MSKRIILYLAGMALLVVVLAVPAFADPGNGNGFFHSNSACNAGGGNGPEFVIIDEKLKVECDPSESGEHNNAGAKLFPE